MTANDEAYFLELLHRTLDPDFLAPFEETPNSGYELLQANARVAERVSLAIDRLEQGCVLGTAAGGDYAHGIVQFYRATATHGEVTVNAGSLVMTATDSRIFRTLDDAVFGATVLGPISVRARAVHTGWEYNVEGRFTTAGNEVIEGEISRCVRLLQTPPYGDPTIQVRQLATFKDGAAPMLDGLGADLGKPRADGETDDAYRLRLMTAPDAVTPGAVRRALDAFVRRYPSLRYQLIETWQLTYQTCFDAPVAPIATAPAFDPTMFVFDDPRPASPFRNRWLDVVEMACTFIVVVPLLACVEMHGMAFDDPALDAGARISPSTNGTRAIAAFDVPGDLLYGGAFDGDDYSSRAIYAALAAHLRAVRAGGVNAILELEGQ